MAPKAKEKSKEKSYRITNVNNPKFCGVDAGSIQFANGVAIIPEGRMVEWFMEHEGYKVEDIEATETNKDAE